MRAKHDDLVEALDGMFDDHHGELAQLLLDQIAFLDERIAQLTSRAAELTTAMPAAWGINADGTTGPDAGTGPDAPVLNAAARLAEIPGVSEDLARAIIAETGLDMSRFPTAAHLVSWAGLCPSARQSGPRTRNGKKGQGNGYLRGSLGQAATAAAGTATFLGERYSRIARRRGKAKAQVAVARYIEEGSVVRQICKQPEKLAPADAVKEKKHQDLRDTRTTTKPDTTEQGKTRSQERHRKASHDGSARSEGAPHHDHRPHSATPRNTQSLNTSSPSPRQAIEIAAPAPHRETRPRLRGSMIASRSGQRHHKGIGQRRWRGAGVRRHPNAPRLAGESGANSRNA